MYEAMLYTPSSYSVLSLVTNTALGGWRGFGKDTPVTGPGSCDGGGKAEDAAVIYILVIGHNSGVYYTGSPI